MSSTHPVTRFLSLVILAAGCLAAPPTIRLVMAIAILALSSVLFRGGISAISGRDAVGFLAFGGLFLYLILAFAPRDQDEVSQELLARWLRAASFYSAVVSLVFSVTRAFTRVEAFRGLAAVLGRSAAFSMLQALWMVERIGTRGREVREAQLLRSRRFAGVGGRLLAYATVLPPIVSSLALEQIDKAVVLSSRGVFADGPRTQYRAVPFRARDIVILFFVACAVAGEVVIAHTC